MAVLRRTPLIALLLPCLACPSDDDASSTTVLSIGSSASMSTSEDSGEQSSSSSSEGTTGASTTTASTTASTTTATTTVGDTTSADAGTDAGTTTDPGESTGASSICDTIIGEDFIVPGSCDGPGGNTSTEVPSNGLFSTSWFGCYYDESGDLIQDPGDNCEFACGDQGMCPGQSGPECEAGLQWFAADADRYGCGARIRVTNCDNGNAVVLTTLDRGPNCNSVEMDCGAPVLDMSHDAMIYLFDGGEYGGCDLQGVVVEQVDDGTPLGPV
jgi:hypothetical protein